MPGPVASAVPSLSHDAPGPGAAPSIPDAVLAPLVVPDRNGAAPRPLRALTGAIGLSRALYSNWMYVRAFGIQIDAGDGAAVLLGSRVGAAHTVLMTHGHADHLLGLPAYVGCRRLGSMTTGAPYRLVYPADCVRMAVLRPYIEGLFGAEDRERITWLPVTPGDVIPLEGRRSIEVFATDHTRYAGLPTVGYAVVEDRTRLTPAARALPERDLLARIAADGRESVQEPYRHTLFLHTGDTMPVSPACLAGADLVVYDATFLTAEDRDGPTHATVEEAVTVCADAGVETVVLHHLSQRYERASLVADIQGVVERLAGARTASGATPLPHVYVWDESSLALVRAAG